MPHYVVAIGASAGGLEALTSVASGVLQPANEPGPIVSFTDRVGRAPRAVGMFAACDAQEHRFALRTASDAAAHPTATGS